MARGRPALATMVMVTGIIALAVPGSSAFAGEFLILAGVFSTGWGWSVVGAAGIVLAAMYMLRLISAVLHKEPGPAVPEVALDLRPAELGIVVPLVALPARAVRLARRDQRQRDRHDAEPGAELVGTGQRPHRTTSRRKAGWTSSTRRSRAARPMIDTPSVDWFALSPSLVALGAAAICLLSGRFRPALAAAAVRRVHRRARLHRCRGHGRPRLHREPGREPRGGRRDHPRPLRRLRPDRRHGRGPAHDRRVLLGPDAPRPHRRVLRAPGHGRRGHGLPRPGVEPDDALPRARMVLGLPVRAVRDRDRRRELARGGPQVPDHRRDGLGRAALRLGARLRLDRRPRLLGDRAVDARPTTWSTIRSCSSGSR